LKALDLKIRDCQSRFDANGGCEDSQLLRSAVELYYRIGTIHPFPDANGRVARLAMNHLLRRYGAGYVIFPPLSEPSPLWQSLMEAEQGRLDSLVAFANECRYEI
jgi:fido (protein-threonine AMPylation protein)